MFLYVCVVLSLFGLSTGQQYSEGQYNSTTPLFGVTYAPFDSNDTVFCLPVAQVIEDMMIISEVTDHIRLHNIVLCPENIETVMQFAQQNNISVIAGLFLINSTTANDIQVAAVEPFLEKYSNITDAIVVNEVLSSAILDFDSLVAYIKTVKMIVNASGYDVPVSYADIWPVFESEDAGLLIDELDFICLKMQAYWEGWDAICPNTTSYECASAGEYVHLKAEGLEDYLGKPVWICESGWPTEGERCCEGRNNSRDGLLAGPSEANATIFINELVTIGRNSSRPTYVHSIFDEEWKRTWAPCTTCYGLNTSLENQTCSTCEVEYHFGIFDSERVLKEGITLPDAP